MRVAIDARELAGETTGVGRYLAELLVEWQASGVTRRHDLHLYATGALVETTSRWSAAVHVVPGAGGTRWEQWDLQRALVRNRPDVLFAPGYSCPLAAPAPVALAVHDVSFFAHPEWYAWREGARRRLITGWSARRARIVLAPSAFSGREVATHTAVDQARMRVVPLGVRPPAAPVAEHRAPLVLFVGSLFQRRHVDVLIDAFAAIAAAHPTARLEIVGANRTRPRLDFAARIAGRGLAQRARLRDWVDEATLETLYHEAAVFVFLSEYEGFGFTPLEAMARGAVPIVLDTAVSREIYGEAAWRVPAGPALTADVSAAIDGLLSDAAARARYRSAAAPVLARFTWAETARRTMAAIEEAAGA